MSTKRPAIRISGTTSMPPCSVNCCEIGHNCGLDHHGYDENIDCVMTADTELDCLEFLDEGTHKFCRACQATAYCKLTGH